MVKKHTNAQPLRVVELSVTEKHWVHAKSGYIDFSQRGKAIPCFGHAPTDLLTHHFSARAARAPVKQPRPHVGHTF